MNMTADIPTIQCENLRLLLEDTVPFWLKHGVDREQGGFHFYLDRDGSLYGTDKPVWLHGRIVWLLATMHSEIEARPEWLELARHGADFLRKHAFDTDGRMFFLLDRAGRPLRKRRYVFSEVFAAMAFSALAQVTGDERDHADARRLTLLLEEYMTQPGKITPKWNPDVRPSQGLSGPMASIKAAQAFRAVDREGIADRFTDWCIARIREYVHDDLRAVLEMTAPDGGFINTPEGRMLCPGHSMEAGWFVLEEAVNRDFDPELIALGCKIIDYSWDWGWDEEFGGIIYHRDVLNKPCTEYWHDMKFWWPQNETIIAMLMAWKLTGEPRFLERFHKIYDWTMKLFPDPEFGEWYGYLHRDGRVSTPLKGGCWKGAFHVPRQQLYLGSTIDKLIGNRPPQPIA